MSGKITLSNVGGIRGTREFEIEKGKLNKVVGANASGKTSVLRSVIATLSVPKDGVFKKYKEDAVELGIKSEEYEPEGFVNIYSKKASVNLEFDGEERKYIVTSESKLEKPPAGDERFLLTGAIMNNSRIIKQLRSAEGGSDFGWLIDELSYADYYELVRKNVKHRIEDKQSKIEDLESREKKVEELKEQREKVVKEKKKAEEKEEELSGMVDDDLWEKREELRGKKQKLKTNVKDYERRLEKVGERVDKKQKEESEIEKEISSLKDRLEEVRYEREELKEELETSTKKHKEKLSKLKEERSKIDGNINLFQPALSKLKEENQVAVKCILCGEGTLKIDSVEEKVEKLKKEKEEIRSEIAELSKSRRNKKQTISHLKDQEEELRDKIRDKDSDLEDIRDIISDKLAEKDKIEQALEENREELEKRKKEFEKVSGSTKEEAKEELEDLEKKINDLHEEKISLRDKIKRKTEDVVILGEEVEVDEAKKRCRDIIDYLSSVQDFTTEMVSNHRRRARERFNNAIEGLLSELGYKGFEDVWLNAESRLMVERKEDGGKKIQPVDSLSLSEKCIVGIILSVSVKESYLPDVPFFVVDDIIQDFDEEKKKGIYEYLERIAEEKNMYVLTSVLDEGKEEVEIVN